MSYICENCGKEFTEDYRVYKNPKTVRFCSKSCKCSFTGKKAQGFQKGHPNYNIHSISGLELPCPYCGRTFGNPGGLQRHIYGCKLNPNYEEIKASGKYTTAAHSEKWREAMNKLTFSKVLSPETCKYCGREFSYRDHCHNHEKYCKMNPNRIPYPSHPQTEETKQKISEKRSKFLKENPDKHPWKRNDKFISQPCEKLKSFLKEQGFDFEEEYTDNTWNHQYSIDIAFINKKIAIEVNGNQHYQKDGRLASYYQSRHEFLENQGWKVIELHYNEAYHFDDIINMISLLFKEK